MYHQQFPGWPRIPTEILQRVPAAVGQELRNPLTRLDGIDWRPTQQSAERTELGAQHISVGDGC